ncbi:hypothetical protein BCR32DRAFT_330071 [Anaeromyces robustus]|uniref:Uncharacterized protein n=1 Tax=Anaeromyces robustus TaxID=1754192 RepID=A0A1Y1WEB5_9FUNG|nr:hypothetical protein BCR32DRAFT_330071 [Anaeromyces robustus]|eukprot:ORX71735.1 hypothetical protein BCR32DRAFT_330071 [Anaeromyces robustus]
MNNFYNPNIKAQTAFNPEPDINAADTTSDNTTGSDTTTSKNIGGNNSGSNSSGNISNNTKNNSTKTIDDDKNGDISTKPDDKTNVGGGECTSNANSLGLIVFVKPIKKSIIVINSNFTIRWRYETKGGFEYNLPQNSITIKLFYEDDSNLNSGDTSQWKNHVYEKTIPIKDVELGPVTNNGHQTYQYNWFVLPTQDTGFRKPLTPSEKYKLRIYGDGKDIHTNKDNFPCYNDGDFQAGTTLSFYIVDNKNINRIGYNKSPKIEIPDDARMNTNMSLILTIFITIILILFNN